MARNKKRTKPPLPQKSHGRVKTNPVQAPGEGVETVPLPCAVSVEQPVAVLTAQTSLVLTVADVCGLLKISRSTLLRANIPGKMKVGGSVRYHRGVFETWLNEKALK